MSILVASAGPALIVAIVLLGAGAHLLWVPRAGRLGTLLVGSGALSLTLSIASRWVATGRPPVLGTFENTLVAAWMLAGMTLVVGVAGPFAGGTSLSRLVALWPPVALGYGLLFERAPMRLEAAGRGLLGYAHAFAGWAGFAVLIAASMAAVGVLASRRPSDAPAWDRSLSRLTGAGLALLTATMASGAFYSFMLFSEWYRWQIVEAFAAAAWIAYGLVLHSRLMLGWKGKRLAWATLAVTPLMLAAFWIWSVYPDTYHYFERILTRV